MAQAAEDLMRALRAILDAAVKVREQGWNAAAHFDNVLKSQAAALAKTSELTGVEHTLGVDVMQACLEWDHAYKQTLERRRYQLHDNPELVSADNLASRIGSLLILLQSSRQVQSEDARDDWHELSPVALAMARRRPAA